VQHPNDFLGWSDLNELRPHAVFPARGENGIAVGQPGADFPQAGRHLLTFRYNTGNNFSYFNFVSVSP
jgi:hypothetical protein